VKRLRYYLPRLLLSVVVFGVVLSLPEALTRLLYRARHGEWPVSLAEVVERSKAEVSGLFVQHSILPFVLRPGARVRFMDTAAEVNGSGFRGPELRSETPLRILAVGASTTFDTGVADNSRTWPQRLEARLGATLPGTEVINDGVPVYMMWANYLKYVLYDRYVKPDIVLIHQGIADTTPWWPTAYDHLLRTDYWLYRGSEARSWSGIQGEKKLSEDPLLPGLFARSIFLRGAYNERGGNENVFANMTRARSVDEAMPDALLERNVDILGYFVSAIRADGAVPILVPQSIGSVTRKRVYGENFPVFVGGLHKLNARYVRYARDAGVKVLDITSVTDQWGDDHFKDFLHFNDAGSEALAALLASKLAEDGDVRRLHASHRGRTSMPTRVFEAAVAFDRPPESLPEAADVSVSLISTSLRGFGFLEGPYPQWNMPRPVRWLEGKEGEIRFRGDTGGKRFILRINVRSIAPDQKIEVLLNGVSVVEHPFRKTDEWEPVLSREFTLAPDNRLTFRAARTVKIGGRDLGVLFDEIALAGR
jgi:lysophospholipase L1-like esterase